MLYRKHVAFLPLHARWLKQDASPLPYMKAQSMEGRAYMQNQRLLANLEISPGVYMGNW